MIRSRLTTLLLSLGALGGLVPAGRAAAQLLPPPPAERAALIALYNSTGGASWYRRDGWLGPSGTECSWFGVFCVGPSTPGGRFAHVDWLELANNGLRGSLPGAALGLPELRNLDLRMNFLEGPIPAQIGGLENLNSLNLQANRLSGPIPSALWKLRMLHLCKLDFNRLSGELPAVPTASRNLIFFSLAGNQLSGPIPPWLGDLNALQELDLSRNELATAIPPLLFGAGNLQRLDLSQNHLSGPIPAEIFHAYSLSIVRLSGNQLSGPLPDTLLQLPQIAVLDLDWNALTTQDDALRAFVQDRSTSPDWLATQTLAPRVLTVTATSPYSVLLDWEGEAPDVRLLNGEGGYTIYTASRPQGPFTAAKTAIGKTNTSGGFINLAPGTTYYYRVDTYSVPHTGNPNLLRSQRTPALSATTPQP